MSLQILDTGGAVKNILPLIDNSKPIVVHNGDIYFDCPADEFLSAAQENVSDAACAATLCLRSGGNMPNVGVDLLGNVCDMRFALAAPYERTPSTRVFCSQSADIRPLSPRQNR